MFFNNQRIELLLTNFIASRSPLRFCAGMLLIGVIASLWASTTLKERETEFDNSLAKLENASNQKEKNEVIYSLLSQAEEINKLENESQVRNIYQNILIADPENPQAYIGLARLDLKKSKATRYNDEARAEALESEGIEKLRKAQKFYAKTYPTKAQQIEETIDEINRDVASYNWCFPAPVIPMADDSVFKADNCMGL